MSMASHVTAGQAATASSRDSWRTSVLDDLGATGQLVVLALLGGAAADRHRDNDVSDERQQTAQVGHHREQGERVADGGLLRILLWGPAPGQHPQGAEAV